MKDTCSYLGVLTIGLVVSPVSLAAPSTEHVLSSRYASVRVSSAAVQSSPLSQVLALRFPASVQTVGDAIHYVLRFSGYQLQDHDALAHPWLQPRLDSALPLVHRHLDAMTLKAALQQLIGEPFVLQVDALRRGIVFEMAQTDTPACTREALE